MDLLKKYKKNENNKKMIITITGTLLLFCIIAFTCLGIADISLMDVINSVYTFIIKGEVNNSNQKIILYLRMPRIIMAVLCGMGLSVAGAAMQAITHNPLVSPFTIGISAAAAFGASIAIALNISFFPGTQIGVVINAFLASLFCAGLVMATVIKIGIKPESIVLVGIALNYLFSAAYSTIEFFVDEYKLAAIVHWTFGSMVNARWSQIFIILCAFTLGFIIIHLHCNKLNILSANSDEVSLSLGVEPKKVRATVGIMAVMITASIISFTGVVGFVGLVGPHIARLIIGADFRFLLPFSAITGAFLVLLADTAGRMIIPPVNIPVGIVIAYLGVPVFMHLVISGRKGK